MCRVHDLNHPDADKYGTSTEVFGGFGDASGSYDVDFDVADGPSTGVGGGAGKAASPPADQPAYAEPAIGGQPSYVILAVTAL